MYTNIKDINVKALYPTKDTLSLDVYANMVEKVAKTRIEDKQSSKETKKDTKK